MGRRKGGGGWKLWFDDYITHVRTANGLSLGLVLVPELPVLTNGLGPIFTRFHSLQATICFSSSMRLMLFKTEAAVITRRSF